MKTLGNIIWIVFGGLHIALEYFIAGLILMITAQSEKPVENILSFAKKCVPLHP